MQRRELNERIDHFPQKILDLLSQKKNKMVNLHITVMFLCTLTFGGLSVLAFFHRE